MFSFVQVQPSGSKRPKLSTSDLRKARSHAMKHFRSQQREAADIKIEYEASTPVPALSGASAWKTRRQKLRKQRRKATSDAPIPSTSDDGITDEATSPSVVNEDAVLIPRLSPREQFLNQDVALYRTGLIAAHMDDMVGSVHWVSKDVASRVLCWPSYNRTAMEDASSLACQLLFHWSKTKDPAVMVEARKRHLVASQLIREKIANPENTNSLLATASKLRYCMEFSEMNQGIDKHDFEASFLRGVAALVKEHERENGQIPLYSLQNAGYRLKAIMLFLTQGKMSIQDDVWHFMSRMPYPPPAEALVQLAYRLCSVLATHDSITTQHAAPRSGSSITKLFELETDLSNWLTEFHDSAKCEATGPSSLRFIAEAPGSRDPSSKPDTTTPSPNNLFAANCEALYYVCVYRLKEALLDASSGQNTVCQITADIASCIQHMCRIIERDIEGPTSPRTKSSALRPLFYFISQWCERIGDFELLQWCSLKEESLRKELPFLDWEGVLWTSFYVLDWLE